MQRQDVTEQAALLRPAEAWLNYFVDRFISFPNSITCPHADRIHTAAMDSEEASATKLVARMFLEQLQQSGQRDHIKEWLFRELESSGWTALLIEQARDVVLPKLLEGANKPIDQDMNATSRSHPKTKIISTAELAHSLSLFGRGKCQLFNLPNVSIC